MDKPTSSLIMHPRHAEPTAKVERMMADQLRGQRYITILIDPPEIVPRQASYITNMQHSDVPKILNAIVEAVDAEKGK